MDTINSLTDEYGKLLGCGRGQARDQLVYKLRINLHYFMQQVKLENMARKYYTNEEFEVFKSRIRVELKHLKDLQDAYRSRSSEDRSLV